jgi:hypothetical protein
MFSLALLVCLIFLSVLTFVPLAFLFDYLKFKILSKIFAVMGLIISTYWLIFAPMPISLISIVLIFFGIKVLKK